MIARMTYALGQGTGPLRGVRVVEIAGIGPGPHAATLLGRPRRRRDPDRPARRRALTGTGGPTC